MQQQRVQILCLQSLQAAVPGLQNMLFGKIEPFPRYDRAFRLNEDLFPFFRRIVSQDGILRSDGTRLFSPEEILRMDWLCDAVDGEIPPFEKILPMSQNIVRLEGIYRDTLPPEKVDVTL